MSSSSSSGSIRNVVFDLGRVLYDFSHQRFVDYLLAAGAEPMSEVEFSKKAKLREFETGLISTDEFVELTLALIPRDGDADSKQDREGLIQSWRDIFTPINEMISLARRLRSDYRTFIISNTNELHWDYFQGEQDLLSIVHDTLTSFEVNAMKPDQKIFAAAEKKFSLVPSESVFIDDIEANLQGARDRGWKTIHHRSTAQTIAELKALGIAV